MTGSATRTLLIDNYDSFTINLYHLLAEVNGAAPTVIRNDQLEWDAIAREGFDNLVISPGPGRPEVAADFGVCMEAILRAEVPVLGVCLGHQGIAAAYGGAVIHAPTPMHGRVSAIVHDRSPLFAGIPQGFAVVRYHSLVVDPRLPACLRASAWTEDGLVMGLEHRSLPRWGVQFHPESILTEHGARLLENFRALTRAYPGRRRGPAGGTHGSEDRGGAIHRTAHPEFRDPRRRGARAHRGQCGDATRGDRGQFRRQPACTCALAGRRGGCAR